MPAHNAEQFIVPAIESVLQQTYPHWELIIVDDGSTDKTHALARKYAQQDPRIKIIQNKRLLGIPRTRNIALKAAQGELVGHIDADDLLHKKALQKMLPIFKDKKIALAYSNFRVIDKNNRLLQKYRSLDFNRDNLQELGWRHFGMYHKETAISVGGFNEKLITCSDGDLFMKIAQHYPCTHIKSFLYYYRIHDNNIGYTRPPCPECPKQNYCEYDKVQKLRPR